MNDLRTAAQQALEALEESEQHYGSDSALRDAIQILRAALEQPEQEPVAWMFQHEETGRMNYVSNDGYNATGRFLEMNPRYALVCALYTHPPRREWRGLTDTERAAVQHESFKRGLSPLEFMELHEAKLKEKNHE
jgi:hypothetical protein